MLRANATWMLSPPGLNKSQASSSSNSPKGQEKEQTTLSTSVDNDKRGLSAACCGQCWSAAHLKLAPYNNSPELGHGKQNARRQVVASTPEPACQAQ
jgi:hypothetical protein